MSHLINQKLQVARAHLDEVTKELHSLVVLTGNQEMAEMVSDLRNRLHEPFMFVIVGEVKAGKSSFINALLDTGKEVTKVAPQPMTDTIQQIVYGEEEEIISINEYLKKILLPVEILNDIAIVDTPGTNTIIEHHQEITEKFIPAADLVVFVFEAKNPYRQSAWQFFDFINEEWHRKVIFILQQKDLMSAEDLQVNIEGLKDYAIKKGINQPVIFAVSAKDEQEDKKENSGFEPLRAYIHTNITGGNAPKLKLQNSVSTSQNILSRIGKGIDLREEQWKADKAFREEVAETLNQQEDKSGYQVGVLVENLLGSYDRITGNAEKELRSELSFFSLLRRSIASIFSRKASPKERLEKLAKNLEKDLRQGLENKLNSGVTDLADRIQQMIKLIDLKIKSSETILKNDLELFSEFAEKRSSILRDLQDAFQDLINNSENFAREMLFPKEAGLSPNLATGSGIAAIGIILMAWTQTVVFDITGGVLTTIGVLFAGVSTQMKKRQVLNGYKIEVGKGRDELESKVKSRLLEYIKSLKNRIEHQFEPFDEMIQQESKTIENLRTQHKKIEGRLEELGNQLSF